jgi:GNAT superfamily N-acetyltransferase
MTSNNIVVAPLGPSSSLATAIADIQFSFWGSLTGYQSAADYERFLHRAAISSALPAVLIACRNDSFIGSVNLLENEMTTRPELSPWMGQLFVLDGERGAGVGRILIDAAIAYAATLGYRRLHLFTSGTLPQFYGSLGWKPLETIDYLGKLRTIMAFDTL